MKKFRKTICLLITSSLAISLFAATVPIKCNTDLDNYACPKTEYQYSVDTKDIYGRYEWKITGGYFKNGGGAKCY